MKRGNPRYEIYATAGFIHLSRLKMAVCYLCYLCHFSHTSLHKPHKWSRSSPSNSFRLAPSALIFIIWFDRVITYMYTRIEMRIEISYTIRHKSPIAEKSVSFITAITASPVNMIKSFWSRTIPWTSHQTKLWGFSRVHLHLLNYELLLSDCKCFWVRQFQLHSNEAARQKKFTEIGR